MLTMRKFFAEYFRRTIVSNNIVDGGPDFTFLELKGLSAFIEDTQSYTISELSNLVHLPLPNITSIINRLAKKGIVKRRQDSKDRRIVRVFLTDKGKKMRFEFMKKRVREVENSLGMLSEKDQKALFNALETATRIFQKIKYS
jgi:DNA-binding MarR family transcriptional regulator